MPPINAPVLGMLLTAAAIALTQWAFRFHIPQTPVDSFIRLLVCIADVLTIIPAMGFLFSPEKKITVALRGFLNKRPRLTVIYVGLLLAFGAILVVEFSCRYYFKHRYAPPHTEHTYWNPSPNPVKAKGDTIKHRYFVNDSLVYDLHYAIDSVGRRHVPLLRPDSSYQQFALLTGCSFMFGYGVEDSGTFAHHVDSFFGLRPYNYAVAGQGPQHLLTMLRDSNLTGQIGQHNGRLFYLYIDDHIPRLIGARRLIKMWARHFPYFFLENGELKQDGTFTTGRPILTAIYRILTQSAFIDLLDLEIPWWTSDAHLELAAAVLSESQIEFHRQFPDGEFLVIIGPNSQHASRLSEQLSKVGVPFADYSRLLDKEQPAFKIHRTEGHPNGLYYQRIAEELKHRFDEHPLP
ncbi:MAG: hypothetical protein K9J06_11335 [Flavobacteriales bacterium]|nr:hypothetical protein [Flavobacteriales bacterium]